MQSLGDVLQNSCSTPLLKKQLNHTYEKLHRGIFYNRSRTTVLYFRSWISSGRGNIPRVVRSRVPTVSEAPEVLGVPGLHGILKYWRPRGARSPGGPGVSGLGPTFLPCLRKSYKNLNMYQKFSKSITHINSKFRRTYWEVAILTRGQIFRK